jgi:hypothetical protein
MGLVLTTTFGLIMWVVLWAIGANGFDAFMMTLIIVLLGATVRVMKPYLPGRE